ncbi:hypothetical protein CC78DRAFT_528035 [Lojkania enalia]|uniref:MARVEL domain-containing protein n=1 Tax=Lojkania enalia TaxID=147567 RepID=A0A9P4NDA6_9PLEO|nr:hypothetical protein CC78DRAFT_528035 [Didymosphaeria enalia]
MADAATARASVLPVPRWTLILHGVEIFLAVLILALSAYGVHWIAYDYLIFALVVCICTFGVCIYIFLSSLTFYHLYNAWVVLGLHIWMVIFWIVDLGLIADLARLWATANSLFDSYSSDYYDLGDWGFRKRELSFYDLNWTSTSYDGFSYKAFYGCLAAGAFFAAVEFVLWVVGLIIVSIYIHKRRVDGAAGAPPAYANNGGQAVVMENKPQHQFQQQPVSGAPNPQPQYAQPVYVQQPQQPQQAYNQQFTGAYQDPVNRDATVSPVSQATYQNTTELATPQHTGGHNPGYNPNASELSSYR